MQLGPATAGVAKRATRMARGDEMALLACAAAALLAWLTGTLPLQPHPPTDAQGERGAGAADRDGGWAASPDSRLLWAAASLEQRRLSPAAASAPLPAPCTLRRARLSEIGAEPTEPVTIADLQQQPGWHTAERWTKPQLLERYGDIELRVGDSLEMGRAGPEAALHRTPLADFVRGGMAGQYSFDRTTVFADFPRLLEDFRLPPLFSAGGAEWQHLTLSVGPEGEGLGFHYVRPSLLRLRLRLTRGAWLACSTMRRSMLWSTARSAGSSAATTRT